MYSNVISGGIHGIDGYRVQVEVDVSDGLPSFSMVGYLSSEVKEAQDRVRTAIRNNGFKLPPSRITVNLSPADVRKEGTAFDLPVAVGILASQGLVDGRILGDSLIVGELGLDGRIKEIRGALSLVSLSRQEGLARCFLPAANAKEGTLIPGVEAVGVRDLKELVHLLNHPGQIRPESPYRDEGEDAYALDFQDVRGQMVLRRATEVAVAGMHNILYVGMAGCGKSMVARRIPTIMPGLSGKERLDITKVYSVSGLLPPDSPTVRRRPFRDPHHTITPQALTGGGRIPKPGEISLASGGVLFLDELPEFNRQALEVLRQPLEERRIRVSRLWGSCEFPADCMLAAAMNPCGCGFYPDRSRCRCSESQVRRYLGRISKPLLDRIDICVEAAPITYEELQGEAGEPSRDIRARVESACRIQEERFGGSPCAFNSRMGQEEVEAYCALGREEEDFLRQLYRVHSFSARAHHKLLKVARTIADLDGEERIRREHLGEAAAYRTITEKYWG